MHANECKRYKVLICLLPEMHLPVPLSPVLRSNVFQPWRILFQITSYNTLTSKSNRMRLCECVTFSQNSCVCVTGTVCAEFRLKAAAVEEQLVEDERRSNTANMRGQRILHFTRCKRLFTPTSSLYWGASGSCFSSTDVETRVHQKCVLLMRPLIQIPHKLDFCLTPGGLGPGFNPFYIPGLLRWATLLCSKLKKND